MRRAPVFYSYSPHSLNKDKTPRLPIRLLTFTLCVLLSLGMLAADAHAKSNPRYASVVMDADTGLILHQRYGNKQLHPASLTKAMTLMLVFDALEEGRLSLNERVVISRHAASMVPSKLGLPAGSSIKVKHAIASLVTKSANDVAVALAEKLGGSERSFARMMTTKAHSVGMKHSYFKNASGLHDPKQVSTARDMAKMGQVLVQDYAQYYHYFSMKTFTYKGKTYRNHNRLMDTYKGMDGLKTGYISAAGFNLVASAVRNNRRIIGVVFGGRTSRSRNEHMNALLDQGFAKLNTIRVASAKTPLPPRKPAMLLALNKLNKTAPASGDQQKWAALNPALQGEGIQKIIGEGDYDPVASRRFETGLIAISAHKGDARSTRASLDNRDARYSKRGYAPKPLRAPDTYKPWAIQIGAFTSRAATDRAIQTSLNQLPQHYARANRVIAPLRTKNGWLFRGRISGFTQEQAKSACVYLPECIPVAPHN